MNIEVKSDNVAPPASRYALGILVEESSRMLFVSGQFGNAPDGSVPESVEKQHEFAWANVLEIVRAAGMEKTDIVDVFAMVTDRDGVRIFRDIRDRVLNGHKAASTLAICELADSRFKVEISLRAARRTG